MVHGKPAQVHGSSCSRHLGLLLLVAAVLACCSFVPVEGASNASMKGSLAPITRFNAFKAANANYLSFLRTQVCFEHGDST
jgi:hypothetical protein